MQWSGIKLALQFQAQLSVGGVGISGNFLLGDLWGPLRFAYTAYTLISLL
jgi:hypothetical protein